MFVCVCVLCLCVCLSACVFVCDFQNRERKSVDHVEFNCNALTWPHGALFDDNTVVPGVVLYQALCDYYEEL